MNKDISANVISQLKEHKAKKRRIAVLRYELEHPANVSLDDVIGTMSFAKGNGESRTSGHISNKTMYIALNYRQEAEKLNNDAFDEIMVELRKLEQEVQRLDFYIGLLEERQGAVVNALYIEGMTLQEAADTLGISLWFVRRLREDAIAALTEMYGYARKADIK